MAKVLVAEDDLNLREVIAMFLQIGGYETMQARNCKEGVEDAIKSLPDVIIFDVMTPMMNGFNACSIIKSTPATKDIPVILCTAKNMKEDFIQAVKVGADDYIVKPF